MVRCEPISASDILDADLDILSLDVFDTAITRSLETPVDVFALAEQRLAASLGPVARGFAGEREKAEHLARLDAAKEGREEVSLGAILEALWTLRPALKLHAQAIRSAEIAAERSVVHAVPEIADLAAAARSRGLRVVFVSDMYLPRADIEELLRACGYDVSGGVLVSSETGCTKASGTQWAQLHALVGEGARILHVGDNEHGDVLSPRAHGIASRHFARAQSNERPGGDLTPAILPCSRMVRARTLAARPRSPVASGPPQGDADAAFMTAFGASWGAVVVGSFTRWLEERVRLHRLTHLYFCARDGWLLKRAWDAAGCGERTGVETHYLHVSRRVLNPAEAAFDAARGRLSERSLARMTRDHLPVAAYLERAGLSGCAPLATEAVRTFGSLAAVVGDAAGQGKLGALLLRHQAEIFPALNRARDAAAGYLHQMMPADGRYGIVDLGWHGTLQSSVARLLGLREPRPFLAGFYYGLWPQAREIRALTGWMEGCFTNDFRPAAECAGFLGAVALLENLHLAAHGSTIGYRCEDGRWTPVLDDAPVDSELNAGIVGPFQDATVEAVGRLFARGESDGVRLAELDPQAGLAAIDRVSLSPTPWERAVLGRIVHAADAGHQAFRPLVLPLTGRELPSSPWSTDWAGGNALAWREAAMDGSTSPYRRKALIESLMEHRDTFPQRTARMFA